MKKSNTRVFKAFFLYILGEGMNVPFLGGLNVCKSKNNMIFGMHGRTQDTCPKLLVFRRPDGVCYWHHKQRVWAGVVAGSSRLPCAHRGRSHSGALRTKILRLTEAVELVRHWCGFDRPAKWLHGGWQWCAEFPLPLPQIWGISINNHKYMYISPKNAII
jgi:hypothetical protein